jgi:DNA gyrase/topoisomerase IV subunit B
LIGGKILNMRILQNNEIMKKINKILVMLLVVLGLGACSDVLDLESLTEPTDATFFSNEQ